MAVSPPELYLHATPTVWLAGESLHMHDESCEGVDAPAQPDDVIEDASGERALHQKLLLFPASQ